MPIYEFRCRKCGEVFERFMKIDEGGEHLTCPYCGEWEPERILSGFSTSGGSETTSSCGSSGSRGFS